MSQNRQDLSSSVQRNKSCFGYHVHRDILGTVGEEQSDFDNSHARTHNLLEGETDFPLINYNYNPKKTGKCYSKGGGILA